MKRILLTILALAAVTSFALSPTTAFAKRVTECTQGGSDNPCPDPAGNPGSTVTSVPPGHVDNPNPNPENEADECTSPNPNVCP